MTDQQRHAWLSWEIIKHKLLYYKPSKRYKAKFKPITDEEYDRLEREYLDLCIKLDLPNTVVHKEYVGVSVKGDGMMEVDMERPSVRLVSMKLRGVKP